MATFTIAENQRGGAYPSATLASHIFTITSGNFTNASGESVVVITPPSIAVKYNTSANGRTGIDDTLYVEGQVGDITVMSSKTYRTGVSKLSANTNKTMTASASSYSVPLAQLFNINNPTVRTVDIEWTVSLALSGVGVSTGVYDQGGLLLVGYRSSWSGSTIVGTITLNAPPSFTHSALTFDTAGIYAGFTTASISVSNLTAYYDGDISSATLTIGSQTDSRADNGALSIELAQAGTFTPTITVTDSRGQTNTVELDPITVNQYVAPSVTIQDLDRTDTSWAEDDEGENAVLQASFSWTDAISDLDAPTVAITDEDGLPVTATISWYADRARTTQISDWSTVTKNASVYAFIGTSVFDPNKTYSISVTPNDSLGESGTAITATLATAFFTMDFLAGGHGIAFGQPSTQVGFECNMPSTFHDTVECEDTLVGNSITSETTVTATTNLVGEDCMLQLDTTAVSGDDKDIYDALVALGWDSEVIV